MSGRKVVYGAGALAVVLGLALGTSGCSWFFGGDDEGSDCLHGDCGGTYCDTNADCKSPHVCRPGKFDQTISGEPFGCTMQGEAGAGG